MWNSFPQDFLSSKNINLFKKDFQKFAIGKFWMFGYIFNF